jgi:hypothetical protein
MFKAIMARLGYVSMKEHTDEVSSLMIELKKSNENITSWQKAAKKDDAKVDMAVSALKHARRELKRWDSPEVNAMKAEEAIEAALEHLDE